MADVKISDLTSGGSLAGSEVFEIETGGASYKVTSTQIQTFVLASYAGDSTIVGTGTVVTGTWNSVIKKRVQSTASTASLTPLGATADLVAVTALATNITINNPTGIPQNGQELVIRITSDATPRTIAFGADYRFSTSLAAPTTTVASRTMYMTFMYNSTATKWDMINYLDNF